MHKNHYIKHSYQKYQNVWTENSKIVLSESNIQNQDNLEWIRIEEKQLRGRIVAARLSNSAEEQLFPEIYPTIISWSLPWTERRPKHSDEVV
mgnify:FL=1